MGNVSLKVLEKSLNLLFKKGYKLPNNMYLLVRANDLVEG